MQLDYPALSLKSVEHRDFVSVASDRLSVRAIERDLFQGKDFVLLVDNLVDPG